MMYDQRAVGENIFADDPQRDLAWLTRELAGDDAEVLPMLDDDHVGETNLPMLNQERGDPFSVLNLTRFHPDHDTNLLASCLPVARVGNDWNRTMWFLISPWRLDALAASRWRVLWRADGRRYARRGGGRSEDVLHRVIMREMLQDNPELRERKAEAFGFSGKLAAPVLIEALLGSGHVHHLDHDTENNTDSNLELVTPEANLALQVKAPGASGYPGVEGRGPYRARVVRYHLGRRQRKDVGMFDCPHVAAVARLLFMLCNPAWMPAGYSPRQHEAGLWHDLSVWLKCGHRKGIVALPSVLAEERVGALYQLARDKLGSALRVE